MPPRRNQHRAELPSAAKRLTGWRATARVGAIWYVRVMPRMRLSRRMLFGSLSVLGLDVATKVADAKPAAPKAAPQSSTLNAQTLTGVIKEADGAALGDAIVDRVFLPHMAGAVDAPVREVLESRLTPEMFGAVGDGVTDDSAAMLAAINASDLLGGREIYCSRRYRIAITLADQIVNLAGPGTLVQWIGTTAIDVQRMPGPEIAVASIASLVMGTQSTNIVDMAEISTRINVASVLGHAAGDVFLLSSQDSHPFGAYGAPYVFQATLLRVAGVGLLYDSGVAAPPFAEGDTVVGGTSGASGIVRSRYAQTPAAGAVVFDTVGVADFVAGEPLLVGGVVKAAAASTAFLVSPVVLRESYLTAPVLNKMPTAGFALRTLALEAGGGDIDAAVGASNRRPGIKLGGVYMPTIRDFTIRSAWDRAIALYTCWGGDFDLTIVRLPNNARAPGEQAYGYGIEVVSASHGTRIKVHGGNCRHGVTSNIIGHTAWQFAYVWHRGTPKFALIHDSQIVANISAGFDTHMASYGWTFANCRVVGVVGLKRTLSGVCGFQNRGFATRYVDCEAVGCSIGFMDISSDTPSGYRYATSYEHCRSVDYRYIGFWSSGAEGSFTEAVYINCTARGDGSAANAPFFQVGFLLGASDTLLQDCRSERFSGMPYQILTGSRSHVFLDCLADHRESLAQTRGLRIDSAAAKVFVRNLTTLISTSVVSCPPASIRAHVGSAMTVDIAGDIVAANGNIPMLENTSTGAAVLSRKSGGNRITYGTAPPAAGAWIKGDRRENAAPAPGGYIGWICVAAGTPGTWRGYGLIAN